MSGWARALLRAALSAWRGRLRALVDGVQATDVALARAELEAAIQARRGVPGALRRWLCDEIHRVEARTVAEWKGRVRERLRLG